MTDPANPWAQPASVVRLGIPGGREVTHRDVAANGARFHIAEVGDGPLVLLLHGFPQFWWTWRHQLGALADAGSGPSPWTCGASAAATAPRAATTPPTSPSTSPA